MATRPRRPLIRLIRSRVALTCTAVVLAAGCTFDEAALVDPGTEVVASEPGQLRVLRHRDDPTAGDRWVDVLEPSPEVVVETRSFREEDARVASSDQPADARRLFRAVGPGRTVLVQVNCVRCRDGVPAGGNAELLVWEFVVGDGGPLQLGDAAAARGGLTAVEPGRHVVVVRPAEAGGAPAEVEGEAVVPVGRHRPADGADLHVEVFVALRSGEAVIRYADAEYPVLVR